jgi:hypothetical protein
MTDREKAISKLRESAARLAWLTSELHGGNEFSKDSLWRWYTMARESILAFDRLVQER